MSVAQSVHDTLKRGRQLMEYETKLCLIKRMRGSSPYLKMSSDLAKNDVEQARNI